MARRIIGLDLGTYSVKLLRLETGKQASQSEVLDSVEELLLPDESGEKDLLERQSDAVMSLFQRGLLEGEAFAVSLSGSYGQMRTMSVPFKETHKINAVLPGLLETDVPFELDEMIFSWYRPEKQPIIVGDGEKSDNSLIRLAFGKKVQIAKTLQMLQRFSIDPRQLHLDSVAYYELVRVRGYDAIAGQFKAGQASSNQALGAIIDFGHSTTNLCVFNREGLVSAKTFLRGGKKLSEDIAIALGISFDEAQKLKHDLVNFDLEPADEVARIVNAIAKDHFETLADQIMRTVIAHNTLGVGTLERVAFVGGGAQALGLANILQNPFEAQGVRIVPPDALLPGGIRSPCMALASALALSCLHVHAKESRFNFRKDEFAWRGELDFLRTKSVPLILWCLVIICSLTVLWSAKSMVLEKENERVESKLKMACTQILKDKNVTAKKCLAMMKEQISAHSDTGIPTYAASDVYVDLAEFLPASLGVKLTELEITENRVRLSAETKGFEEVDKVVAGMSKIPCLVNIESGRAQTVDKVVRFTPTGDIDCKVKPAGKETPQRGQ